MYMCIYIYMVPLPDCTVKDYRVKMVDFWGGGYHIYLHIYIYIFIYLNIYLYVNLYIYISCSIYIHVNILIYIYIYV